jgi:PII-like signaling protein
VRSKRRHSFVFCVEDNKTFEKSAFAEGLLLRIVVSEDAHHGLGLLYDAVVLKLREKGITGATVFRGVEGFGRDGEMRVNGMFSFHAHSPVLIEAVDSRRAILANLPELSSRYPFIHVLSGMVVVDHQVPVLERLCPQAVVLEEGRAIQVGTCCVKPLKVAA